MPSQQQVQQQQPPMAAPQGPTRWCPTPEQLMILEEMYRGGLRTPNASQIQQITAHLAAYGRIEGKNVFYWFQNHKARDRQKLRRRLCMSHHLLTCAHQYYAAAAHGHHHHAFLTAAAPAPAYGCGGVFDQQAAAAGQLLAQTSPTPATAAAAYGYYYPASAAFTAAPPPASTAPPSPNQPFNIYHQGRGGVAPSAEALVGRADYSLGKLDNFGVPALDDVVGPPPGFEQAAAPFCRPLKTLDLFPGGLRQEEQHDVA